MNRKIFIAVLIAKTDSISTGGTGSGGGLDPLASQGSLVLSEDHRWLLAVNAGSNEVSVLRVLPEGLKLVDKVDSGGGFPVSVTIFHDLVYVLNAGMSSNISGFYLTHRGNLIPLAGSTRLLGTGGFAQVGFDPQGETLVVIDRADRILVYPVDQDGLPAMTPVVSASNGPVPFAFIFDRQGHLLVVEVGSNAVTSYNILHDGTLEVISPSVANGQTAACWIAGNKRGNIFTANPGTSSISSYKLRHGNGEISLLDGVAGVGDKPLDLSISVDGRFLYALDPGNGGIDMYRIERDGSLTDLGTIDGGLSVFAQGIAAL
jgi:6-phosphogluconolactonase